MCEYSLIILGAMSWNVYILVEWNFFLKTNDSSKHLPLDMLFIYTICGLINILSYKLEAKLVPYNFGLYIIQELHDCSFLMLASILKLHQAVYPLFPWLCHFM